jgi:hypothetical protein
MPLREIDIHIAEGETTNLRVYACDEKVKQMQIMFIA